MSVSRETRARLEEFCALVEKWSPKVNLVSRASLPDLWTRHVLDSLQIVSLSENTSHWVDLGSGGGFPGLVVAIALAEQNADAEVTLVESDQRKSAFLRTAIRHLELTASVTSTRIETLPPLAASTLSARALAPLSVLLGYTQVHLHENGQAVFMKGASWEKEVQDARQEWSFQLKPHKSQTDDSAAILVIRDVKKL